MQTDIETKRLLDASQIVPADPYDFNEDLKDDLSCTERIDDYIVPETII